MVALPEQFLEEMKHLLGEEYEEYLESMEEKSSTALRINTLKITPEEYEKITPYQLTKIPWTPKGYIYQVMDEEQPSPSRHPHYYAGLYYIQEPSAMIPAQILPVQPGDHVLDLCAAPGGKATELAAKLQGKGLLVANDISVSRTMALAKNLQMMGATNAVVTAESPQKLAEGLPEYFDKVLIDAPCSGEGMFRRDPHMVKSWLEHGPDYYAPIQEEILESAWELLKPGGSLVYSTCTFSVKEDEQTIQNFLNHHEDMAICPVEQSEGFCSGRPDLIEDGREELARCIRIFPHKVKGEGHFAVLMEKGMQTIAAGTSENVVETEAPKTKKKRTQKSHPVWEDSFWKDIKRDLHGIEGTSITKYKDACVMVQKDMIRFAPFRTITEGLLLGEYKKERFDPSVQLALTLSLDEYAKCYHLKSTDSQVVKYLKGETIVSKCMEKGYILICVDGYPLGWCKGNGNGTLKNKYYPGWRMM